MCNNQICIFEVVEVKVFFNWFILSESYGSIKEVDISWKANSWTFMAPLIWGNVNMKILDYFSKLGINFYYLV